MPGDIVFFDLETRRLHRPTQVVADLDLHRRARGMGVGRDDAKVLPECVARGQVDERRLTEGLTRSVAGREADR